MRVLSLFSGIGGLDLGFEWAGFETVAFCEIEKYPQQVLNKHWPNVPIIEDVRNVTRESVSGRIDVIVGGFPCQDISYAGKGAGIDYDLSSQEGTRSGLWWEYWRTIRELRPRYVVAENVSALTNRGLDIVLGSLAQIGYDAEWQIVSAAGVGAAHIRERIFIVAYPNGEYAESIRGGEQPGGTEPSEDGGASEVLADGKYEGVQIGRGADGPSEYVRNEGGVRENGFGKRVEEETREALAHPNGGRMEGEGAKLAAARIGGRCSEDVPDTCGRRQQGPGGYVDAEYSEKEENRQAVKSFYDRGQNQPDRLANADIQGLGGFGVLSTESSRVVGTGRNRPEQPDWFGGLQSQPHPVSFKVSDTSSRGLERTETGRRDTSDDARGSGDGDVDNTNGTGLEGAIIQRPGQEKKSIGGNGGGKRGNGRAQSRSEWMEIEYDFRGVAYGVSDRVGALKGYGNAVVPQVAYLVAMAVRQHAEENGLWE